MKIKLVLIGIIAVTTFQNVIAQNFTNQTLPSLSESDLLRAQLELSEKYNESILNTVYWSIGVTTALFALLLGIGWFGNFRLRQKDKELILSRIDKVLSQKQLDLEKLISSKQENFEKTIANQLETNRDHSDATIKGIKNTIVKKFHAVDATLYEFKYEKWMAEKIGDNALRELINWLEIEIAREFDWGVAKVLDRIIDLQKNNGGIRLSGDADVTGDLHEILQKVPEKYSVKREQIISAL